VMLRLRIALVSGIVGLGLLASPSIAGDLSGMFSLTKGKTNFGPKSAKYDFNDINFLGRLVLKDSYFVEFEHSNLKHSSLNKKHTIKPYWTKVGYQFSLGNDNENDLLSKTKFFASLGYYTYKTLYAGEYPDAKSSGISYSIGATFSPSEQFDFSAAFTPIKYNSGGAINGKRQRTTDLAATYYFSENIGWTVTYRYVDSRWLGSVDSEAMATGIVWKF
jgi:predicted porin